MSESNGFRMVDGWGCYPMDKAWLMGARLDVRGGPTFARGAPMIRGVGGAGPLISPRQYDYVYRAAHGPVTPDTTWAKEVAIGTAISWSLPVRLSPGRLGVWYLGATFPDRAAFLARIEEVHRRAGQTPEALGPCSTYAAYRDDAWKDYGLVFTVHENLLDDLIASACRQLKRSAILMSPDHAPTVATRKRWEHCIRLVDLALAMSPGGAAVDALALLAVLYRRGDEAMHANTLVRLSKHLRGGYTRDGVWSNELDFATALADAERLAP